MATFPQLKSGVTAQYPLRRRLIQNVDTVMFVDGGEQRCPVSTHLHEWTIRLDAVDEAELAAIHTFVQQQQGEVGSFEFTDPVDHVRYADCSFTSHLLQETFRREGSASLVLVIRENPK